MPDDVGNVYVVAVDNADVIRIEKDDSRPPAARSLQSGRQQATCGRKKPAGSGPGRPARGQGQDRQPETMI
jgi:hypothetical protein